MQSITNMRILFVIRGNYLPQKGFGGIKNSTHEFCLKLKEKGCEVAVLASLERGGFLWLINRLISKSTGRRFPADYYKGYKVYRGIFSEKGIQEVIADFKPSAAIIQKISYPELLADILTSLGVPSIIYFRDAEFPEKASINKNPLLTYIANSKFTAQRVFEKLNAKSEVIYPLVSPEIYRTERVARRVVFINPHPYKGVDIAFQLAERRPDIIFDFVESWQMGAKKRNEYRARTGKLKNIRWHRGTNDMKKVYRYAKVLLAPSVWEEPWGRISTEAHINGIPVLASNRGGLPESVGPGGILVDMNAPISEWLKALSRLWDDNEEYDRFSQAALEYSKRQEIQPDYLIDKLINCLQVHIDKCAGQKDK